MLTLNFLLPSSNVEIFATKYICWKYILPNTRFHSSHSHCKPTRILFHAHSRRLSILVSVSSSKNLCRWKDYTIGIRQVTVKLLLRRKASKIILEDQPNPSQIDINYDCEDHNPAGILKHTFPVHGTVVQCGDLRTRDWHTISLNPIYTPQFYNK